MSIFRAEEEQWKPIAAMPAAQGCRSRQGRGRDLIFSGELPHLEDAFRRGICGEQHLEQGITWLLDGIERQYGVA
ncbi:hypothetical protein [Actinomadura rudentiformis]|uniref:Uncharacterized protein n=1 Tax=Actinomadura rudentiformis TaxID=359158 RepID=A0A6H9Z4H0_9ACTN|nr:hypothetical protein [Actinomadura rudentiformis]KAB2350841.1 hypothetical protein F8566_07695 [Actinomadura rudentiformis]